mmetsp:Transcript_30659/g.49185  ORF Transcript_30659/g.49185 Transcript_30659/m.49185 type:complete len:116 (-) Transcript_30659:3641-3988(-)|eukprot:CAMPEP_0203770572 /NCGR_PEP_ID=MMETSP0099_2-20121227/2905_1 /ASSEMBLY_ACC=CAM_ASM_000209 /TAXON_ID=96639 /ORGANISM=" , Strain NY0313808BC1" /LENGTH=115 /DNA_ID=CAMNT_0050667763 /DNA_START=325 /DNA_END=672 /DNA_ORIENTATION=+
MAKGEQKVREDVVSADYTINLRKRTHKITFKKKAPRAMREIRKFAQKAMGTKEVKIDAGVNKFVWSTGIRKIPGRVRVRLSRKRNDDEDAKEKLYTVVEVLEPEDGFHGLTTQKL